MTSALYTRINQSITLTSSGAYTSPFTIAQAGVVNGSVYSALGDTASPYLANEGVVGDVNFRDGGTVVNSGTVSNLGLGNGVLIQSGNGTITNSTPDSVIYGGNYGIEINNGSANITNFGSIGGLAGAAIQIKTGKITNEAGASIYAHEFGITILNDDGEISNSGKITGNQYGVFMNGGTVTNTGPSSTISGQLGALFDFSENATINNSGTILQQNSPFGTGVKLFGGTINNTGFIYGATGISIANSATVFNSGTIGAMRDALILSGDGANRLIVAPGAVFRGDVIANSIASNTLEFTAGQGTLNGIEDILSGFNTIAFDNGAEWNLIGTFSKESISGFTTADSLDLANLSITSTALFTLSPGNILSLSQDPALALTFSTDNSGEFFELTPDGHNGGILRALTIATNAPAITLQAPSTVQLTSTIDAYGIIGTYGIETNGVFVTQDIGAAIFDPANTPLTITNNSFIESDSAATFSAGIVLRSASSFVNDGTVIGASGIDDFSTLSGSYVESKNCVIASLGSGIYIQHTGNALNTGNLSAAGFGILLGRGDGYNYGQISAGIGIATNEAGSYVYNVGQVSALKDGITMGIASTAVNAGTLIAGATGISLTGGTAYNYGSVNAATGIQIGSNGYVYNSGYISANTGILLSNGGTIVEYGTLTGRQYAASFGVGASNRMVINEKAKIEGEVFGGNGVLELASGASIGTLSFGQFVDFSEIEIDSRSQWNAVGNLTESNVIENNGSLTLSGSTGDVLNGDIIGDGTIIISSPSLTIGNSVSEAQKISFSERHETLLLSDSSGFSGKLENFRNGDTIDIGGISIAAGPTASFANNVLTISAPGTIVKLSFLNSGNLASGAFDLAQSGDGLAITVNKVGKVTPLKTGLESADAFLPTHQASALSIATCPILTASAQPGLINTLSNPISISIPIMTLQL